MQILCVDSDIMSSVPIQALTVTEDGRYVITGGFDCRVRVFSIHNMKLKYSHEPFNSSIRSLFISKDQRYSYACVLN